MIPASAVLLVIFLVDGVDGFANNFTNIPAGWVATNQTGSCRFYHCQIFDNTIEFPPAVAACRVTTTTPERKKCLK
jgi:hypothetical protein